MKRQPNPKSKILNPWPKQKRRKAREVIEWDLKTYEAVKKEIEEQLQEIEEMTAPSAVGIQENIYLCPPDPNFIPRQEGDMPEYIRGKTSKSVLSDPTVEKAEQLRRYRTLVLSNTEFKEAVRRINAIERVLERLDRSSILDNRQRAELIRRKYFRQEESDQQIMEDLKLSDSTYYRWVKRTIYEIAKELGFII